MIKSIANNGFPGKILIMGGGISLVPNGMNLLAALGLAEKIKARVNRDLWTNGLQLA